MSTKFHIFYLLLSVVLVGCSANKSDPFEFMEPETGSPRLIIRGSVTNTEGEPLRDISVDIFEMNLVNVETALLTYNYAVTDQYGKYTIIRYRGRELPQEMTIVATDPSGIYQQQERDVTIVYDSVLSVEGKIPYNGYATADFVLSH